MRTRTKYTLYNSSMSHTNYKKKMNVKNGNQIHIQIYYKSRKNSNYLNYVQVLYIKKLLQKIK